MTDTIAINLMVVSNNPHHLNRAHEALARIAAGLALEGIETHLGTNPTDCEDCDE